VRGLVTGGSGFVGNALVRALRERGHETHVLVRPGKSTGSTAPGAGAGDALAALGAVPFSGDIGDPNAIAQAARGCDVLFHCAGESALHAPQAALSWINVAGTENAINAARHAGVTRVVVLSCADVSLINGDRVHWKENAALAQAPLGAWARTKLLSEELALQASDAALSVTALRPAWLWGPGDHTNAPALCAEARRGGMRLFGNGQNLFSSTYIDNLVDAMIAAASADGVGGHAFHVADPDFLTASEFFGKLCTALALPPPRTGNYALSYAAAVARKQLGGDGAWPEDVARRARGSLLDCMRAINAFAYAPRINVEQGMTALAAWARASGGPEAIAKLARTPASTADVAHHERLASDHA
jgi:2-alkyl-3-oxoalkanoate reductase